MVNELELPPTCKAREFNASPVDVGVEPASNEALQVYDSFDRK